MSELAAALGEYLRRRTPPRQSPSTAVAPVLPGSNDARPHDAEASDEAVPAVMLVSGAGLHRARSTKVPSMYWHPLALLKSWRRWTATVESFALGRLSRRSTDRQAFRTLRNQLLVTLRACTAGGPRAGAGVLSPPRGIGFALGVSASLAREDREILHDLLVSLPAS